MKNAWSRKYSISSPICSSERWPASVSSAAYTRPSMALVDSRKRSRLRTAKVQSARQAMPAERVQSFGFELVIAISPKEEPALRMMRCFFFLSSRC